MHKSGLYDDYQMIILPNKSRLHAWVGWGVACFWWCGKRAFDVAAAGGLRSPLIMYTVILAPQRVAGVLRRRGGLVDVVRRPSRNDNSSNAGAV